MRWCVPGPAGEPGWYGLLALAMIYDAARGSSQRTDRNLSGRPRRVGRRS
jgi:hypothetical protein